MHNHYETNNPNYRHGGWTYNPVPQPKGKEMKKTIDARFIKIAGRNAVFQIGNSIHVLPIPPDTQAIIDWNNRQPANQL